MVCPESKACFYTVRLFFFQDDIDDFLNVRTIDLSVTVDVERLVVVLLIDEKTLGTVPLIKMIGRTVPLISDVPILTHPH